MRFSWNILLSGPSQTSRRNRPLISRGMGGGRDILPETWFRDLEKRRGRGGKGRWFPKIERFSAETYLGYGTVREKEREGEKDMSNPSL